MSTTNYVLPTIGVKGTYQLKAPFNALIDPNIAYTCQAIRTISEMLADKNDPYTICYQPAKLTQQDYTADKAVNMQIVYLASDAGDWIYVPASYIIAFPDSTGVSYHSMALSVLLGPIESDRDLSVVMSKIQDVILANLGITCTIQPVEVSEPIFLSQADSDTIQNARKANISENSSTYALWQKALSDNADLQTRFNALQNYIQQHLVP